MFLNYTFLKCSFFFVFSRRFMFARLLGAPFNTETETTPNKECCLVFKEKQSSCTAKNSERRPQTKRAMAKFGAWSTLFRGEVVVLFPSSWFRGGLASSSVWVVLQFLFV